MVFGSMYPMSLGSRRFVELGFIFVYWTLNLSLSLAHATVLLYVYLRRVDTEQISVVVSALVTILVADHVGRGSKEALGEREIGVGHPCF